MREPETQETFDSEFSTDSYDVKEIAEKIDDHMAMLRRDAGDFVRRLFMRHGYFNGCADSFVTHRDGDGHIQCKMIVTCYGLPCRTIERGE